MDNRIDVYHHLADDGAILAAVKALEGSMSQLSDKIASLGASVDSAIGRVQGDIQSLTGKIADLQALVDSGGATPGDLAAIADLQAKLDALDPSHPATLPPAPAPESPVPEPAPA